MLRAAATITNVLYPAQSKGLKRICWQMESESDLDKLVVFGID